MLSVRVACRLQPERGGHPFQAWQHGCPAASLLVRVLPYAQAWENTLSSLMSPFPSVG